MTVIDSASISSAASWLAVLVRPHRTLRNLMTCWSAYDPSTWTPLLETYDRTVRFALVEMLVPALLLGLLGSLSRDASRPTPVVELCSSEAASSSSSFARSSLVGALSPYASVLATSARADPDNNYCSTAIRLPFQHLGLTLDAPRLARYAALAIASPASLHALLALLPVLSRALGRLGAVIASGKRPDADAIAALSRGAKAGRVVRRRRYDLYLPPPERRFRRTTAGGGEKGGDVAGLLFYPGFGVHHGAYAEVMTRLSERGVVVCVASLEPFRLAHESLGGGMDDALRLVESAGRDASDYLARGNAMDDDSDNHRDDVRVEWALGGHSMGGYNAMQLAKRRAEMMRRGDDDDGNASSRQSSSSSSATLSKMGKRIVLWAAGTHALDVPDLRDSGCRALLLLGSNDEIAKFASGREMDEVLASKFPTADGGHGGGGCTVLRSIRGANHSGFASYDADSKRSKTFLMNGRRDISLDEQHEEASTLTARFLLDG